MKILLFINLKMGRSMEFDPTTKKV